MKGCLGVLFVSALAAQQPGPEGIVRGTLVDQDSGPAGDLSVRTSDHRVHCIRFDGGTAVEQGGWKSGMRPLGIGDTVEIETQSGPQPRVRRARVIRVVDERPAPRRARSRRSIAAGVDPMDELFPRGDLLLSGIVKRLSPGRMLLATRTNGEMEIVLRDDTRYLGQGQDVGFAGMKVNARVSVRAGRNLDDVVEAYQVMWGGILTPHRAERRSGERPEQGAATAPAAGQPGEPALPISGPPGSQLLY